MTTDESRFKATLLYEITETKRNFVSFRFEQRPNMRNFVPFRFEQNCKTGFFDSFRFERNWNWCNFVSFRFERSKKTCFSFRFVSNTKNLVSNNPTAYLLACIFCRPSPSPDVLVAILDWIIWIVLKVPLMNLLRYRRTDRRVKSRNTLVRTLQ